MKTLSKTRFRYTEKEMADAFLRLLQLPEGLPEIGGFDGIYREVSCHQGRPDFIALRYKKDFQGLKLPDCMGLVGPTILTILKPNAPRTLSFIISRCEFSEISVRRALRQLLASGHVKCTGTGSYQLGDAATQLYAELWAFELKLNNPKRAVFQAQQSRAYANRALIVVPPGQEKHYIRYNTTMTRWGIGVATFDPANGIFRLLRRGRNTRAICPQHQIYALSRIRT